VRSDVLSICEKVVLFFHGLPKPDLPQYSRSVQPLWKTNIVQENPNMWSV
jgi:hypothetical protein